MLTDSSELWQLLAEMLGAVPGEGARQRHLLLRVAAWGAHCLFQPHCKTQGTLLLLFAFFVKAKILFGFLRISKNRY